MGLFMAELKAETAGLTGTTRGWGWGGGGRAQRSSSFVVGLSEAQKPSLRDRAVMADGSIKGGPADGASPHKSPRLGFWEGRAHSQGGGRLWGQTTIMLGCHTKDSVSRTESTGWAPKPLCPLAPSRPHLL